jgi:hypothetical protein
MKNKVCLFLMLWFIEGKAQVKGTLEQIYYYDKSQGFTMGPLLQVQNKKNWFAEARYNYEEAKTVSFYIGKVYERKGNFSYALIPLVGGVAGRFNGGSIGFNMNLEYHNFYFASQTQYTFSVEAEIENFYFTWSELGYQPLHWFYGGVAVQETYFPQLAKSATHPGIVIGFSFKNWTLPLYAFRTNSSAGEFICSILYEW